MAEVTEVHTYQHNDPTPDERMVSVELSQGQSGKRGCTVKAYGATVEDAVSLANRAFAEAQKTIED